MKVHLEMDDGTFLQVRAIESVPPGADVLLFFTRMVLREADQELFEKQLSERIGKRCVILPRFVEKVAGT